MATERPDAQAAKAAIRTLLRFIGEDPDRDGLGSTPSRIIRAMGELLGGYEEDPRVLLGKSFQVTVGSYDQMIICKDIDFVSFCEHHCLPFVGKAHIAYIPSGGRVVGLSKLARLVDVYAKRLQIQERLTKQIARALEESLRPQGVAVLLEAQHQCMSSRGVKKVNALMVTSELVGSFLLDPRTRDEFLRLVGK